MARKNVIEWEMAGIGFFFLFSLCSLRSVSLREFLVSSMESFDGYGTRNVDYYYIEGEVGICIKI